ncbi:MAG: TIR domain-containing protein [Chloroflexi bacterium]|nr:TIR domain-containing protein [Chloroflexota bacterium]
MNYKLDDVFNEAYIPTVTFVEPKEFTDLLGSLKTKGKHITLSGPSGSGKTTLARKTLEKAGLHSGNYHWISGREYSEEKTLQNLFAKIFWGQTRDEVICDWLQASGILIIDDFHHLNSDVRTQIGYKMKLWHEKGIRLFLIGIASTTRPLLDLDQELGIRNDLYEMKIQDDNFVRIIISLGEEALNFQFSENTKEDFIEASQGIPSAIQAICRIACIRNNIENTLEESQIIECTMEDIKDAVIRSYKGKYQNKVIGLAKGKQNARSVHNTYFDIIRTIGRLQKSEISYEELQESIVRSVSDPKERSKKNTSFYNCLKYLQSVIEDRGLSDALYCEPVSRTISIEDPSFKLFLSLVNWDEIKRNIRLRSSQYSYDVAVSFSGKIREIAERFKDILEESNYSVFYDFDEQETLWGKNLREYLANIYANEAQFMVIFLSEDYPEKDWPAFEFEIGKEAQNKRTSEYLLPVIVDDVHIVGLNKDIAYLDLRELNIEEIAEIMKKKLEQTPTTGADL